jgi:hypothetical protein
MYPCIGIGMYSISIMGTVRVSSVKFYSIYLRALSACPAGGFPATAAPLMAAAAACGRGRHLFRAKLAGRTGPTSACITRVTRQKALSSKNMIYIQKDIKITYANKKKNSTKGDLPISPRASPGGTGISGSLEKSIPAYG